jgi:hypothetical protein
MNSSSPVSAASMDLRRAVQREVELVEGAIKVVASGAATGTTVAGIRFGEEVLRLCRPMAALGDVILEPIWRADDSGADIHVRSRDAG